MRNWYRADLWSTPMLHRRYGSLGDRWFCAGAKAGFGSRLKKLGDPYPIEWITKEEFIKLAGSLVNERPTDAVPPLDPNT